MKTTRSTEATNAVYTVVRKPACAQRPGLPFATLAFAALAGSPVAGWAQLPDPDAEARAAAERFAGSWTGALEGVGWEMRLQATVADDGSLAATFFSVDEDNAPIPVEEVEVDGASLSLSMARVSATFEGVLSEDGTKIEGTFTQMGYASPLTLERQEEAETGQASLFGEAGGSAPHPSPRLPTVPEWAERDRLAREKEVLSRAVELACVVTAVARQVSRRDGSEWAKITVEGFAGTATVLAFRDAWQSHRERALEGLFGQGTVEVVRA